MRGEFIGFGHAKSTKDVAISDSIVRFLADVNLDIRNVPPQCYDGVANISMSNTTVFKKTIRE